QNHDVVNRDATILEVDIGGKREPRDGVDLTGGEHRFTDWDAHVLDRDLRRIDAVGLDKNLPVSKSPVGGRCAELLAFEVFWDRHAAALAGHDREGRAVVDHEHGPDWHAGVLVAKLDERIDIAEAHVVDAGGHTRDWLE